MVIGNKKETFILVLHADKVTQGAKVITKVKFSC
jgi:hypothetical protein